PGIMFRDISPLLANATAFKEATHQLAQISQDLEFTHLLGIESRGFIFGAALANELSKPLILARKPNKLPLDVHQESYGLEYGTDLLEMQKTILPTDAKVLLIDDVLATGGTLLASAKLVEKSGARVAGAITLLEISFLAGTQKLANQGVVAKSVLQI
ncbi:MAG: adenine phosphoribosyltransferase, partial [Polynucleobacter victoriensis]